MYLWPGNACLKMRLCGYNKYSTNCPISDGVGGKCNEKVFIDSYPNKIHNHYATVFLPLMLSVYGQVMHV